jgi:hypothetical protein
MSTHPNVILLCTLTPDDLARKTYRAILEAHGVTDKGEGCNDIVIGSKEYRHKVMETEYDDSWQIGAEEGDIIVFDLVTYGYGEQIAWNKLEDQKAELEKWAIDICDRFKCTFKIAVTANYW